MFPNFFTTLSQKLFFHFILTPSIHPKGHFNLPTIRTLSFQPTNKRPKAKDLCFSLCLASAEVSGLQITARVSERWCYDTARSGGAHKLIENQWQSQALLASETSSPVISSHVLGNSRARLGTEQNPTAMGNSEGWGQRETGMIWAWLYPWRCSKHPSRLQDEWGAKESGKKHLPNREARKPECPPKKQLLSLRKAFNNNGE